MSESKIKIYKSDPPKCHICGNLNGIYYVFCKQPEEELISKKYTWDGITYDRVFTINSCKECLDKIPYEQIPVKTTIGEGFMFFPERDI